MIKRTIITLAQLSRVARQAADKSSAVSVGLLLEDPLARVVYSQAHATVDSMFPLASSKLKDRLSVCHN